MPEALALRSRLSTALGAVFISVLLLLSPQLARAAAPHVQAELIAEHTVWSPGRQTVALRLQPQAGWHTYWRNPGDAGQATTLAWTLPDGVTAGEIRWPVPKTFIASGIVNIGYDNETLLLVDLVVPDTALGRDLELRLTAQWLACSDTCVPEQAQLQLRRRVAASPQMDPQAIASFAAARARLPATVDAHTSYRVEHGRLQLRVAAPPDSLAVDTLRYFTERELLLDSSQPQQLRRDGDALVIEQALLADAEPLAGELRGVLATTDDAPHGWTLVAMPAPIPAAGPRASAFSLRVYGLALLLALAGGLVLNLMPCVFPVLSIKAIALLQGREQPATQRRHALVYTLGVIVSCVAIAIALLAVRSGGQALGWGFQLQSPFFVGALAYLLFVMGLSLSGALHVGTGLMGLGQSLAGREGYAGSFFTGVLAVVVASPCTAPFMGTALGYAMTQAWPQALSVFAALGLGLASPFLVLAWWPAAARLLPRPGAWMDSFKQAMAFPLYFTVVWLLWVLGRQAGIAALVAALCGLVLIALGVWTLPRARWLRRTLAPLAMGSALLLLALPAQPLPAPAPSVDRTALRWETFSDARLEALRTQGKPVFVNLTADWCLTCKLNERVALDTDRARAAYAARDVVLLKGDWTRSDPAITAVLARFGRNGVPLYVYFPPHGEPQVLPQLLTPGLIAETVGANADTSG